jgi:hypothetical protein
LDTTEWGDYKNNINYNLGRCIDKIRGKMKLELRSGERTLEFGEGKQGGRQFHISMFQEFY